MLDPKLVRILRNPLRPDGPPLEERDGFLVSPDDGVRFPIIDGIPHLLPEDAIFEPAVGSDPEHAQAGKDGDENKQVTNE